MWAGAYVLTVATVLPDRGLASELVSSLVGHRDVTIRVTHLALGRPGKTAEIGAHDHAHESLDPMNPRAGAMTARSTCPMTPSMSLSASKARLACCQ